MKNVLQPLIKDRTVSSLCPACLKVINARIFQYGEAVMIDKRCEEHGDFRDTYWSDVTLYKRFMIYWIDGSSIDGSSQAGQGCPFDCGLCENHKTGTLLGNIDVTSRCNLACLVSFADAVDGANEPTMAQLRSMMQILREQRPVRCGAYDYAFRYDERIRFYAEAKKFCQPRRKRRVRLPDTHLCLERSASSIEVRI